MFVSPKRFGTNLEVEKTSSDFFEFREVHQNLLFSSFV